MDVKSSAEVEIIADAGAAVGVGLHAATRTANKVIVRVANIKRQALIDALSSLWNSRERVCCTRQGLSQSRRANCSGKILFLPAHWGTKKSGILQWHALRVRQVIRAGAFEQGRR